MTNTEQLCADWLEAKRAESMAREQRISIETELAAAFDVPAEGSKTHQLDNYKLTLTQPITRKLDTMEWDKVSHLLPANLHPVKIKVEADATGCKYLANKEPDMWRKIASAFETKPGKIGVKVERK